MLGIRQRLKCSPRKQGNRPTNDVNIQTPRPSVQSGYVSRQFIAILLLQLLPATALLADGQSQIRWRQRRKLGGDLVHNFAPA